MSQRTATVATSSQRQDDDQQQRQSQHAKDNHLMPASLRRVPSWFQLAPFQYNLRFMIAFLPGALLVATVTGKLMIGATILGVVVTLLLRSSDQKYLAMLFTIAHIFILAILNVYCMASLVWQSVLNFPLSLLFHAFIATSGLWWFLQDEEFRNQDPRFIILVEKALFSTYPGVCVAMVTWVCAMLFGRAAVPYTVAMAGLVALSLFVSPLKSSFSKPNTPSNTGLIQHWSVALIYISLELTVPGLLYFTLFHTDTLRSWTLLSLLALGPVFIMTLLESQGLLSWLRLGSRPVQLLRWTSGTGVMLLLSLLVVVSKTTSLLPLLLIPLSVTSLSLLSSLEATHHSPTTLTLAITTTLLMSSIFTLYLPWTISYSFSFLSLPLSVVQVLIWCIAVATIAMVTFHERLSSTTWLAFNIVFVMCEYVLSWDDVYSSYVALSTACMAAVLFWRLHTVGKMTLNSCLLISSLHLTKLSLLLPPSLSSPSSPITTTAAIFLLSYLVLRLFLFQSHPLSLSPAQLLVFSGLLCCGLLLGVDSLLSPLWISFTHQPPSSASLIGTILAITGLFMNHGLGFMRSSETGKLTYWPPGLVLMSVLLFLFQPPFDLQQLSEAVAVIVTGSQEVGETTPTEIITTAWVQLLSWLVVSACLLVMVAMVMIPSLVSIAATLLGGVLGVMATVLLATRSAWSLDGLLYLVAGAVTGGLLGRCYATPTTGKRRSFTDYTMFMVLVLLMVIAFITELVTAPHMYMPRMHWFDRVSVPCSRMGMAVFGSIALAFRVKMSQCSERPYLSLAANTSCLLFFFLSLLNPLHAQYEVSVVLSSLVFLLLQPDGRLLPASSSLFLAPSLLTASTVLYVMAGHRVVPKTLSALAKGPSLFLATRCLELVCLVASIPSQAVFLYYLWSGHQLQLSIPRLVLYILPNAFLPQFGGTPASTILGIMGVLSFCLIMLGDMSSLKLT